MRFRNVKPRDGRATGNGRAPLLGRHVRSRLFVAMDLGRQFTMPDLPDRPHPLITPEDDPSQPSQTRERGQFADRQQRDVSWKMDPPDPLPPILDTIVEARHPLDARAGGVDEVVGMRSVTPQNYTVTGTTVSTSLNVTSPTAANCAQVLSSLLAELQKRGTVRKI